MPPEEPRRVVSLVPSLTETLFALGAGSRLVGRTRYCIHPEGAGRVPVVGGTKDPDLAAIAALGPDLILCNQEENRREDVEALAARTAVLVCHPRRLAEVAELLDELGRRMSVGPAGAARAQSLRSAMASPGVPRPGLRVVSLIWRRPWMSVNHDTYLHDLLTSAGALNPFAGRPERYPRLAEAEILDARPDLILLPNEPYPFDERHRREVLGLGLAPRAVLADGEPLLWWGARSEEGLGYARRLLAAETGP